MPGSAGMGKKTLSYTSWGAVPTGIVNVALTTGAGNVALNGSGLREGASSTGNAYYRSAAVFPDVMSGLFTVSVTAAAGNTTDRGIGPGVFSADGTKGVAYIELGSTNAATIYSWSGGTLTAQATKGGEYATASGVILMLIPTISSGVVTWSVTKNGTAVSSLSWTDSSHLLDIPGQHPAMCFQHSYSSGQFYSQGCSGLAAADL